MGLGFSATNLLTLSMDDAGAGVSAPTLTGTTTDGWAAYGFSKATGTVAPRFHKYIYATGTASHETSGSTLADGIAMGVGHVSIGRRYSGNATLAFGSYLAVALYARPLTDAEFEAAVISLSSLINSNPNRGLWVYDKPVTTAGFAEMMIGSGSSFGTPGAADASGPIGYGHSIF